MHTIWLDGAEIRLTEGSVKFYSLTSESLTDESLKVEGEAQGDDGQLEKFLSDIKKGPSHASVSRVDEKELEIVDGEESFEVRHWRYSLFE